MSQSLSLADIFEQHTGRLVHKWSHYFPVYERYLSPYRGKPIRMLEIGVSHGGSLQLWKNYLGAAAALVGVDIDPRCRDYAEDRIDIEIGDQSDPQLWARVIKSYGDFDVIIDDGSHIAHHQRTAFLHLWPHLRDGGVYIVEDCHTAYWAEYGGGVRTGNSFVDFSKDRVDDINALWSHDHAKLAPTKLTFELGGLHFHDSMVVFEKKLRTGQPYAVVMGSVSHPDPHQAVLLAVHGKAPER